MIGFLAALVAALVAGSLVEYWGHRLMHAGVLLSRGHRDHHDSGRAKGVVPEFAHYMLGVAVLLPLGFAVSRDAGLGWLAGATAYGLFSAYGHQLQHDSPAACFWMRSMPVHYVHHLYDMRRANFGLALDVWDRVFGTYRPVRLDRAAMARRSRGGPLAVHWLAAPAAQDTRGAAVAVPSDGVSSSGSTSSAYRPSDRRISAR